MDQKPDSVDFEITVTDFRGSYTWGLGDREHFLNNIEMQIRGTISNGPSAKGKDALIDIETIKGEEPESYDKEWFKETVSIGRVEVGDNTLQAHAVVARSGIQSMLHLLNTDKEIRLFLTCIPLDEDISGGRRSDLLRLWLEIGH